jgi:hypothetical protein
MVSALLKIVLITRSYHGLTNKRQFLWACLCFLIIGEDKGEIHRLEYISGFQGVPDRVSPDCLVSKKDKSMPNKKWLD